MELSGAVHIFMGIYVTIIIKGQKVINLRGCVGSEGGHMEGVGREEKEVKD